MILYFGRSNDEIGSSVMSSFPAPSVLSNTNDIWCLAICGNQLTDSRSPSRLTPTKCRLVLSTIPFSGGNLVASKSKKYPSTRSL